MAENFGPGILGGVVLIDPVTGQPYRPVDGSGAGVADWSTLTGKPAVMAVGATQGEARTAIGVDAAGTASAAVTAHEAALDPHPGYLTPTEADAAYATVVQGGKADTAVQPAGLTKAAVGLGSADNTADASKPVSTAQQTALNLKANLASPTFTGTVGGVTKTHVGLSNVDNTADASKPVSTAQQTALDLKATDTLVVHNSGNETVNGIKTFVTAPLVPDNSWTISDTSGLQTALDTKYDAPADLPVASTTTSGIAELATSVETLAGTDAGRVVSVSGLQAKVDALNGIMGQAFVIQGLTGARVDQRSGAALGTNTSAIWVGAGKTATNEVAGDVVIDTTEYMQVIPLLTKEVLFSYTVPAAATIFNGNGASLRIANLNGFTQARVIQVRTGLTNGAAGSKLVIKYVPLSSGAVTAPASMSDLCTSELASPIDANGTSPSGILDSGWIDLATGAKQAEPIVVGIVASGGNGSTSVNFQGVYLLVK